EAAYDHCIAGHRDRGARPRAPRLERGRPHAQDQDPGSPGPAQLRGPPARCLRELRRGARRDPVPRAGRQADVRAAGALRGVDERRDEEGAQRVLRPGGRDELEGRAAAAQGDGRCRGEAQLPLRDLHRRRAQGARDDEGPGPQGRRGDASALHLRRRL
ncbi:MAG: hypothetical protein AVDCRST_MAG30-2308, partial [uncultured Solirubrobacteraceae bacterium]